MKEPKTEQRQMRDCVLAIKVTADERLELARFAADRCINVSALVRKLLFEQLRKEQGCSDPAQG